MIKFENTEVVGWEAALRGMRNPKNSWNKSDSRECARDGSFCSECTHRGAYCIGPKDHKLAMMLRNAGTDHRKFMRMIAVYVDITAPMFWWKEFDTYKVGTVRDSCSTMHTIYVKPFTPDMFSHEGIDAVGDRVERHFYDTLVTLNWLRNRFNETHDKTYWRALIELLPDGFNMKATVMLNYEVIANAVKPGSRRNHKLLEWNIHADGSFCQWAKSLPYSELIFGEDEVEDNGQSK